MSFTENCTDDYVALRERNATGEYILEPSCIWNAVRGKHFTSVRNVMDVAFRSNNSVGRSSRLFCLERKCGFQLNIASSKIECGGDISDDAGRITTPGYPGQLHPHIFCEWLFRAGIGYRYVFDFAFIKHENFYRTAYNRVGCYPDIHFANGLNTLTDYYSLPHRSFCSNRTRFVSATDFVTLRFDDRFISYEKQSMKEQGVPLEKIYAPFRIDYLKVRCV
ncbi:unnamed protein product [Gongylonema pulchrum]|uniref:CUB domain-containing protein n=1 Tax=Gongylonema pulchrum TaxID=637853 RepID=A0A183CVG1_9BILA|nr:unnamed protein product [Gongylonema pulchrum]